MLTSEAIGWCMEAVDRREKVRGLDMLVGLHDG